MNRSLAGGNELKSLGLTRSVNGAVRVFSVLFDHLVCSVKHRLRDRQADLACCLEVDDELKFHRLLNW